MTSSVCRGVLLAAGFFLAMPIHAHDLKAPAEAAAMVKTAEAFIAALTPGQRQSIMFGFEDPERFDRISILKEVEDPLCMAAREVIRVLKAR